jgi:arsenite methyltransferase
VRHRLRALLPRLHLLPALSEQLDQWAEWLVRTRFAGWSDEEVAAALEELGERRNRVLDGARVERGATVADVGAGTGLLTFGAVKRVGPDGDVIAVDVSVDALEELRANATAPNIAYLVGQAEVLPLLDATIDGIVTRSVLIYVDDKAEAAREFARVLRPGGRVSLFEPINRHNLRLWEALDLSPLGDLARRVKNFAEASYANPDDPMLNFDEDDLERCFIDAGFADVRVELGTQEHEVTGERYLNQVGAPGRATLLQRWTAEFDVDDVNRLVEFLQARTVRLRYTHAFLTAVKP